MRLSQIPFKNVNREVRLTARRSWIALLIILVLVSLLIGRLAYLQIYKNLLYTTLSTHNSMDVVPLEPTRGLIYDRNGILLADNIPVFSLDVVPNKTQHLSKEIAEVGKVINLSESDLGLFKKQLKQRRRFEEIPLKLRLSEVEVSHFAENQHRFPGFLIRGRLIRHYSYGGSFSHVLGYLGQINSEELNKVDLANYSASHYIGKLGIEKYFEDELHGKAGYQEVETDAHGFAVRVLKQIKPVPGRNFYLSIDSRLQLLAEKAMGGHRGALVAIEPDSGQILALVSMPGYDANLFVGGISTADFRQLQQLPDHPLYNRAVRGLYPLASTIKPYLALHAIDNDLIAPEDTIHDPGWFMLKNSEHVFRDMHAHGTVNLSRALITSCDVYFYELGNKLGIRRIDDILHRFGYGEVTGVELEEEVRGVVSSPEWKRRVKKLPWYEGDTINSSIGQGNMQATPLQLAAAMSTLANRGKRSVPTLLFKQQEPEKPVELQAPILLDPIVLNDPDNWEVVIAAMQKVVDSPEGTARRFGAHRGYSIAAKTGTAQVHSKKQDEDGVEDQEKLPEALRDHGLFIAFAPVDRPKIALALIIENDRLAAVPIAKTIIEAYLNKSSSQPKGPRAHEPT